MRFSEAIEECINGRKITREDWNGRGMYVWFVPPHRIPTADYRIRGGPDDPTPAELEKGFVDIAGHFDMMNAQGLRIIGWLASQTDLASDKWLVIPERGGAGSCASMMLVPIAVNLLRHSVTNTPASTSRGAGAG